MKTLRLAITPLQWHWQTSSLTLHGKLSTIVTLRSSPTLPQPWRHSDRQAQHYSDNRSGLALPQSLRHCHSGPDKRAIQIRVVPQPWRRWERCQWQQGPWLLLLLSPKPSPWERTAHTDITPCYPHTHHLYKPCMHSHADEYTPTHYIKM